jgi:hypothetical protein
VKPVAVLHAEHNKHRDVLLLLEEMNVGAGHGVPMILSLMSLRIS